jgi:hypothetical protein
MRKSTKKKKKKKKEKEITALIKQPPFFGQK